MRRIVGVLPPAVVRLVGRLQFRLPWLRAGTLWLNQRLTEGEVTIKHGVGAGLRFDATGGQPGYALGTSEPREQEMLTNYLRPGSVFYDIGANVGFFSTLAGRLVAPGGTVWAFEPSASAAEQARRNATRNGFDHVTVVEAAAGREPGRLRLELGEGGTQHRLALDGQGPLVEVVSIDDWQAAQGAPDPDLVLIDVEGSELDVLAGMMRLIHRARPVIGCEVHWLGGSFLRFAAEALEPLGYGITALEGGVPLASVRWHALLIPEPIPVGYPSQ